MQVRCLDVDSPPALRDTHRDMAEDAADLALEVAHPGFASVVDDARSARR